MLHVLGMPRCCCAKGLENIFLSHFCIALRADFVLIDLSKPFVARNSLTTTGSSRKKYGLYKRNGNFAFYCYEFRILSNVLMKHEEEVSLRNNRKKNLIPFLLSFPISNFPLCVSFQILIGIHR